MSLKDQKKWDKKYATVEKLLQERPPSQKLTEFLKYAKGKDALDVASGNGRNSIYLAKNGFEVDAVDIASAALKNLDKKNYPNIHTKLMDLDTFTAEKKYDVIVKCNYLDRELIPKLADALKSGGILLIETYMEHPSNTKPDSNPDFLLKSGELKTMFDDRFEILDYYEFDNESHEIFRMKKASVVARKR